MKKILHTVSTITLIFVLWTAISLIFNNPFICPQPIEVIKIMIQQTGTTIFYQHISATVLRTLFAFSISFLSGLFLAILLYKQKKILKYAEKIILVLRSVPNVTFIILFLFWLDREHTIMTVSFLLLFPIVFQNSLTSLEQIDKKWKNVLHIYPQSFSYTIKKIYIPLMKPSLIASAITTMSLAFKVGVMAEILAQTPLGIGRGMQWAKLNVDLAEVIAWTLWLLILVFLIDALIKKIGGKTCH